MTPEQMSRDMDRLDRFASAALTGYMAQAWHPEMGHGPISFESFASIANSCYELALEMLKSSDGAREQLMKLGGGCL